jgi:4-aminobutyrate aminotransferase-like enzyme
MGMFKGKIIVEVIGGENGYFQISKDFLKKPKKALIF